jgi:putative membrane protein insertion efficiency factor
VSVPSRLLVALVRGYQWLPKPWADSCRYAPTCSEYGAQALAAHGALRGSALTVWRVLRCNPFTPGGFDPVPARRPRRRAAGAVLIDDVEGIGRV